MVPQELLMYREKDGKIKRKIDRGENRKYNNIV